MFNFHLNNFVPSALRWLHLFTCPLPGNICSGDWLNIGPNKNKAFVVGGWRHNWDGNNIQACECVPFVYLHIMSKRMDVSPSASSRFIISSSKKCAFNLYLTKTQHMLTTYLSK